MFALLIASIVFAQTFDEQTACIEDLEVCQTQVTILTNSLTQIESIAAAGSFKNCNPANLTPVSTWWADKLTTISDDIYVCHEDVPYWAVQMEDGSYRSTCVAYSDDLTGSCPSDEVYCSLILDDSPVYGYAGNVLAALQEALATSTKTHPFCPKGSCSPINDWLKSQMELEGISSDDASKICLYGDSEIDQYYYVANGNTIQNTCVVEGANWNTECVADASRVCSGISGEGFNIIGWPRQQARMIAKAMESENKAHPQCTTA